MQVTLDLMLELELYDLSEWREVEAKAEAAGGEVYCWQSSCRSNWLRKGLSIVNVLGLVVLPKGLPETIDVPDDEPE